MAREVAEIAWTVQHEQKQRNANAKTSETLVGKSAATKSIFLDPLKTANGSKI